MNKFSKDRFFKACGGTAPIKLQLENRETRTKKTYSFEQPNILIGQQPLADIRVRHPDIGPRHLYLQLLGGRLFAVVFPGEKAVRRGKRVKACGWLGHREALRFGPFALRVVEGTCPDPDGAHALGDPMVSSSRDGPPLCLEQRHADPQRAFRGKVNRSLTLVGNADLCKFRIHSDRVSGVHCSLVRAGNGVWAVDLGGGGILVNETAVSIALLEDDDFLELGGIPFQVHYDTAPPEARIAKTAKPPAVEESRALVKLPGQELAKNGPAQPDQEAFERLIGPVLDRFTTFQAQTFQQFQDLLGNVMQMFGAMFQQQQDFVREEMRRYDRLTDELGRLRQTLQSLPAAGPANHEIPFALESPLPPTPERVAPPQPQPQPTGEAPDVDPRIHLWLQSRITELDEQRNNLWSRLLGLIRGKSEAAFPGQEEKGAGK